MCQSGEVRVANLQRSGYKSGHQGWPVIFEALHMTFLRLVRTCHVLLRGWWGLGAGAVAGRAGSRRERIRNPRVRLVTIITAGLKSSICIVAAFLWISSLKWAFAGRSNYFTNWLVLSPGDDVPGPSCGGRAPLWAPVALASRASVGAQPPEGWNEKDRRHKARQQDQFAADQAAKKIFFSPGLI